MTSPRLQFTPMQELRAKMRDLMEQLYQAKTEDERINIHSAMCDIQNQMERIGDAAFDKALN